MFEDTLSYLQSNSTVPTVAKSPIQTQITQPFTVPTPVLEESKKSFARLCDFDIKLEYITDSACATEVINNVQGRVVGLDIETAALPPFSTLTNAALSAHLSRPRTLQLYAGDSTAYVIDLRHTGFGCLQGLRNCRPVVHNALFEMEHLHAQGIDLPHMDCTMLMYNALHNRSISLRDTVLEILNIAISKEMQVSDWGVDVLSQEQLEYAALDAVFAFMLYEPLQKSLQELGTERLYDLLKNAQWAVMDMRHTGVKLNIVNHKMLIAELDLKLDELKPRMEATFGTSLNLQSTPQVSKWINENLVKKRRIKWPRTDKGNLMTGRKVLAGFRHIPVIDLLYEYEKLSGLKRSFSQKLITLCNPKTGRLHPNFSIAGAITGRMTCSNPSMHSMPRDKVFRALLEAPAGRKLICADYSQMQLRIAAELSHDPLMLEVYNQGGDLHRLTAKAITGREEISGEDRQCAKAANFGLVFGQKVNGFKKIAADAYNVILDKTQAQDIINAFFNHYKQLRAWQLGQIQRAQRSLLVKSTSGRVYIFEPDKYADTHSLNYPVQGAESEALYATFARLSEYISDLDAHVINCVHDEILLEASDQDAEAAKAALERAMLEGFQQIFPNAPTKNLVEAHIGQNWAEAKG